MKIIDCDNYFMGVAYLSSLRSKDDRMRVGACIINEENRIISTGYNGMPNGCEDSTMPWALGQRLENKHLYVVHAELNAILSSRADLRGCVLYSSLFPCNECAKAIVQSGIAAVVYSEDKHSETDGVKASKIIFDTAGIPYRQMEPSIEIIIKEDEDDSSI